MILPGKYINYLFKINYFTIYGLSYFLFLLIWLILFHKITNMIAITGG
jgi:hypothetical protein